MTARATTIASGDGRRRFPAPGRRAAPIRAWLASWTGSFAAASQRLGEEGERAASRSASSGRRMELPGVGREHQDGLDELARHFVQVREGVTLNARWEHRVEQQAKEAARWQARQEERERRGLPREPEQDRERERQTRGLGLGR